MKAAREREETQSPGQSARRGRGVRNARHNRTQHRSPLSSRERCRVNAATRCSEVETAAWMVEGLREVGVGGGARRSAVVGSQQ